MTSPDAPAIDLRNIVKIYRRRVHALQGVSLCVRRGEIFGLLGPNGAGKSTLVKIMMTVVLPTHARGAILGNPIGHKLTLARVGYLPENHRFPRYLTGRQALEFMAALSRADRGMRKRRAAELLEVVGMAQWGDTKISAYSKGMAQRIGLAQALVHDPELVVLDEPTDGVDPVGRREILDVLGRLRGQGKTVFINSHALSELETICDRVAILVRGQVARQGTIDELTIAKQRYEIELASQATPGLRQQVMAAVPAHWRPSSQPAPDRGTLGDGLAIELDGPTLRIATMEPVHVQGIIDALRRAGLAIRRVQQVRPSLEDLFLDTVAGPVSSAASSAGGLAPRTTPEGRA